MGKKKKVTIDSKAFKKLLKKEKYRLFPEDLPNCVITIKKKKKK